MSLLSKLFPFSLVGVISSGYILFKYQINSKRYEGDGRLDGQKIVVTGANGAIGSVVSKELARRGAHVIMTCRCLKKCKDKRSLIKKEIPSANISIYQLNLTSRNSINDFCKDLFRDFKSIDILINNAAVKEENKVKDESGLNLNLSTNFLGPFLLTLKLLPLLSNEGKGKILNVISPSYFGGRINFSDFNKEKRKYNKYDSYAQSKMALAMMTLSLNEMGEELNVSSLSIDPMSAFSHHGIPKSNFFFNIPNKAIHSLFLKSPLYASQCYLKACIEDFENNKDKVLTHLNWVWYTKYCKDKLTRDKLWLTAKKWTGID